jgi:nucleoside-diphosphate-sugar epimerase
VLLTGASSFTGYWFAKQLREAGHEVVAPVSGARITYSGTRGARIDELSGLVEIVWNREFGGAGFLELVESHAVDVLCLHGARTSDYRSPDFDVAAAFAANTRELPRTLRTLRAGGLSGVVLTGSVFEPDEGTGSRPLRAFSPYGVTKGITATYVRHLCEALGLRYGKFVISNPFGPYEEERFCSTMVAQWTKGLVPQVRTPRYVRDNIHVDLLARAYVAFVEDLYSTGRHDKCGPSGYVETQGDFALRFAEAIGSRLGIRTELDLLDQSDFPEPRVRFNTDSVDEVALGWSEHAAWDRLAEYYRAAFL